MTRAMIRQQQRSCGDKAYYHTWAAADLERQRHGHPLYVYRCPWCHGYHLTKKAQHQGRSCQ